MKEKVIELLKKYEQESEMFEVFIADDEFDSLATDLVKLFAIPDVSNRDVVFENASKFPDEDIECDATEADIY
jgi:hypothetical protein